ncbi:uncharacterized protein LOC115029850 [Mus caroli]|uniref:Uncharacterized protein LOC115029850 n=1 Tax=Mus caroli TaxID=10089 RepID=A0A6P7QPP3_MUSCR|nr:uncharacterized protein LOC115029850 [Mus caroli]
MFSAQAPTRSPGPPESSRLYLPRLMRAAQEQEYRSLLMFPDCPAQPANIPRVRYPCSRAAREEAIAPVGRRGAAVNPSGRQQPPAKPGTRGSLILPAGHRSLMLLPSSAQQNQLFLSFCAQRCNPRSCPEPGARVNRTEVALQQCSANPVF